MSKFKRSTGKAGVGKINTASLPDIVFMLLFFFMTISNYTVKFIAFICWFNFNNMKMMIKIKILIIRFF